jgi:hypothetical protein
MEFDVKLVHTAGPKMVQSDALSRQPDYTPENDTDNKNITLLTDNLFVNLIDVDLQNRIMNRTDMDKDTIDALSYILDHGSSILHHDLNDWTWKKSTVTISYSIRRNTTSQKTLTYIVTLPKCFTIMKPGELETFNVIRQHYWWPGLQTFIKNYVQGCGTCQQFNIN